MKLAELFKVEFHSLPDMVDYRKDRLGEFREVWAKVAKEVKTDWSGGAQDPTEAYFFPDGSVAFLDNPGQVLFPAFTDYPQTLLLKWKLQRATTP